MHAHPRRPLHRLCSPGAKGTRGQLAIDDFGADCSSLSYLRRSPVDAIKIDHSIVEGNAAIVSAAIIPAHALGLEAIAEGVETEGEAAELRTIGCDVGQKCYWLTPRSAHAAAALLEANLDS